MVNNNLSPRMDIGRRIKFGPFTENMGRRLWKLADLDKQPKEVQDHYFKIAAQRARQWFDSGGGLEPEMASTLAFSIFTEGENSWAEIKKEMDNPVVLSMDKEAEDDIAEEADYVGWLKKKGYLD